MIPLTEWEPMQHDLQLYVASSVISVSCQGSFLFHEGWGSQRTVAVGRVSPCELVQCDPCVVPLVVHLFYCEGWRLQRTVAVGRASPWAVLVSLCELVQCDPCVAVHLL